MHTREILIVDDDRTTLKMLEKLLIRSGYSVIPLSLGKEAIRIAKERSPDVVILDIMMPDMDGGEVANILKSEPATKNIPIIFLSSLIKKNEEKSSSRQDGICLISKPFEREELIRQIENYCRNHSD
jgi:CheY-like chemotaxis protein